MPRHADHAERRTQLADAAVTIAATDGLGSVTVSRVAAQAGFSVGLVQHYFPAKQDLLAEAYRRTLTRAGQRVDETVARGESARAPIRDTLTAALAHLLPLDESRRAECLVRAQFHGRAAAEPGLAEIAAASRAELLAEIARAVENGRECGETGVGVETGSAAWELLCLTTGFSDAGLLDPSAPAESVLAGAVGRIFPNPCRRPESLPGRGVT